jgi:hypothetical protein
VHRQEIYKKSREKGAGQTMEKKQRAYTKRRERDSYTHCDQKVHGAESSGNMETTDRYQRARMAQRTALIARALRVRPGRTESTRSGGNRYNSDIMNIPRTERADSTENTDSTESNEYRDHGSERTESTGRLQSTESTENTESKTRTQSAPSKETVSTENAQKPDQRENREHREQ